MYPVPYNSKLFPYPRLRRLGRLVNLLDHRGGARYVYSVHMYRYLLDIHLSVLRIRILFAAWTRIRIQHNKIKLLAAKINSN